MALRLSAAGCVAPSEEAAQIVRAASGDPHRLESMVRRRESGEPLAWVTGRSAFCGRPLVVSPGVFVPRAQTEELARRAAAALPPGGRAADLCTGSGALAAHLGATVEGSRVVAVDIDPGAVACARRNGVAAVQGDVGAPLRSNAFQLVTAVAPYVPTDALRFLPSDVQRHEPQTALDGGEDGLRVVERVVLDAARLLVDGGAVLLEVGGDQAGRVTALLGEVGFVAVTPWHDDDGDLRGIGAVKAG